jgi:phosphoenolpyruvate-protein kinase (PTS system EI component)
MLETPSVLFELEDVLRQVDFVSIGTNDLVQFMLAAERRSADSLKEDAIFQPAILRALHDVARRGAMENKPLSVCGEAAGNPLAACLLVGLGIDRLSMSPVRARAFVLRSVDTTDPRSRSWQRQSLLHAPARK